MDSEAPGQLAVHADDLDGTPVFWARGSGPPTAAIIFRIGDADEPAPLHGISHLVEHLALAHLGAPRYDFNGVVESIRTTFFVSGTQSEVADYLASVTSALSDLPSDRTFQEREILGRESEDQGRSIDGRLRFGRFGAVGHGVPGIDQYALAWAGPATVRDWAVSWFTRGNAALVLNRQPWPGLRLNLRDGNLKPPPPVQPVPDPPTPFLMRWELPDVALSVTAPPSTALLVASAILRRRAFAALRINDGLAYDVGYDYELLGPSSVHAFWSARGSADDSERISDRILTTFNKLADDGPTDLELEEEVFEVPRRLEHPDGQFAFTLQSGFDHLLGLAPRSANDVIAARRAVTPELARGVLKAARASMIAAVPFAHPPIDGFAEFVWSHDQLPGAHFKRRGFRLPVLSAKHEIVVGDDGFTSYEPGTPALTIQFADLAVALHQLGDRLLLAKDGFFVGVLGAQWKDSDRLIRLIDSRTPDHAIACWRCKSDGLAGPEALANPHAH